MTHPDHIHCADVLRARILTGQRMALRGLGIEGPLAGELIVSDMRVVAHGFSEESFTCPHGVRFWIAPDAEMQQAMAQLPL